MKKSILAISLMFFLATSAWAFLYEVQILSVEEIKKFNEDQLMDAYINAVIEREASETFHGKAGFTPKEYKAFKDLLGYIIRLRKEMVERSVEPPPVNEWLK